jgi:prevent-host-death family protein
MKHRVISATEFKAKCLALLDEVAESGGTITVTKRGRAVATLGPAKKKAWKSTENILAGKCGVTADIVDMTPFWKDWEPGEYLP